jgi:hypothetical protein
MTAELDKRSVLCRARFTDIAANGCFIGPCHLQDVVIENLKTNDLLIVWGATFDRVTLRGEIGKLKFNTVIGVSEDAKLNQAVFDAVRHELYGKIDWALDISEARFKEFEFTGIPARLIKRDPESQMVVTRERALATGWRDKVSPANKLWPFMVRMFLADGADDAVFVAPMGAPKRKRDALLGELRELRDLGVLEPG